MDIEILPNDLDWSHHIGNPKKKKKERPIIVKACVCYFIYTKIFFFHQMMAL